MSGILFRPALNAEAAGGPDCLIGWVQTHGEAGGCLYVSARRQGSTAFLPNREQSGSDQGACKGEQGWFDASGEAFVRP